MPQGDPGGHASDGSEGGGGAVGGGSTGSGSNGGGSNYNSSAGSVNAGGVVGGSVMQPGRTQNFGSAYADGRSGPGTFSGVPTMTVPTLNKGVRVSTIPTGTNRKNQSLQDISTEVNRANYASSQGGNLNTGASVGGQRGAGETVRLLNTRPKAQPQQPTFRTEKRVDPKTGRTVTVKVPIPQPKPAKKAPGLVPTEQWPGDFGMPIDRTAYAQPNIPTGPAPPLEVPDFPQQSPPYDPTSGVRPNTQGNGLVDPQYDQAWGAYRDFRDWARSHVPDWMKDSVGGINRQFGGPVEPGEEYTVGENGPETLQMDAFGGGNVIPHNPADRRGGLAPDSSMHPRGEGVGAERHDFNDPAFREQRMAQYEALNRSRRLGGDGGGFQNGAGQLPRQDPGDRGGFPRPGGWPTSPPAPRPQRPPEPPQQQRPQRPPSTVPPQRPRPGGPVATPRGGGLPGGSQTVAKKLFGVGKAPPTPAPRPRPPQMPTPRGGFAGARV